MKRRIIGILGLALSASLIASACGSDSSSSSDTAESTDTFVSTDTLAIPGTDSSTPTTGGTIHILSQLEQVTHLDPQRNYTGSDLAFVGSTMQRALTSYAYAPGSAGSQLVGDLATDTGTPTEGGKVWSFTLRGGATYEDGSEVTCADIAYGTSRVFATDIIVDGPTYAISYLDIPVLFRVSSPKGPYFEIGPQASILLGAKESYSSLSNSVANPNYSDKDFKDDFNGFGLSGILGFGVDIKISEKINLNTGLRFGYTFTDATSEYSPSEGTALLLKNELSQNAVLNHTGKDDGKGGNIFDYQKSNRVWGGLNIGLQYSFK
jgi:ABC-type transport system substrate-binding protein